MKNKGKTFRFTVTSTVISLPLPANIAAASVITQSVSGNFIFDIQDLLQPYGYEGSAFVGVPLFPSSSGISPLARRHLEGTLIHYTTLTDNVSGPGISFSSIGLEGPSALQGTQYNWVSGSAGQTISYPFAFDVEATPVYANYLGYLGEGVKTQKVHGTVFAAPTAAIGSDSGIAAGTLTVTYEYEAEQEVDFTPLVVNDPNNDDPLDRTPIKVLDPSLAVGAALNVLLVTPQSLARTEP